MFQYDCLAFGQLLENLRKSSESVRESLDSLTREISSWTLEDKFHIYALPCIIKHLMTSPKGNSEFCFSQTLNVSKGEAEGNIEVEWNQNSLFPLETVI